MIRISLVLFVCFLAPIPTWSQREGRNKEIQELIEKLAEISSPGYGYSSTFSGSQFLPYEETESVHTVVFIKESLSNSAELKKLVEFGIDSVPFLLEHLDDSWPTKIPAVKGLMWMSFQDEYDYNRRTVKNSPAGVNLDGVVSGEEPDYRIKVGDICYVALGQIMNRSFNATRYQPSGGLVVNSPVRSKSLCRTVREAFSGFTREKHRQLLIQDILQPDNSLRARGAYQRLAYFYPEDVETVALKYLERPMFDTSLISNFIRSTLYKEKDTAKRKALFDKFVQTYGQAGKEGILEWLFRDLHTQEADEQRRLHPALDEKYEARNLLIQLYRYPDSVNSSEEPFVDAISFSALSIFLEGLVHDSSTRIDNEVFRIFREHADNENLAIASFNRLIGRGYDQEIKKYCEEKLLTSKQYRKEFQEILKRLKMATRR